MYVYIYDENYEPVQKILQMMTYHMIIFFIKGNACY